jgi:hypothetical protein
VTARRAVIYGGLTIGLLDGLDALIFFGPRGVAPERIFQAIAAGLIGRATAFGGGWVTTALGAVLHLTIALTIATVYYQASLRVPTLVRRPLVCGPLYGVLVYLVMNLIVIPLSALGRGSPTVPVVINGVLIHLVGVGLPAALFARRAQALATAA